jgi:hypothetical protein
MSFFSQLNGLHHKQIIYYRLIEVPCFKHLTRNARARSFTMLTSSLRHTVLYFFFICHSFERQNTIYSQQVSCIYIYDTKYHNDISFQIPEWRSVELLSAALYVSYCIFINVMISRKQHEFVLSNICMHMCNWLKNWLWTELEMYTINREVVVLFYEMQISPRVYSCYLP